MTGNYESRHRGLMPIEQHPCDLDRKWKPDHADCSHVSNSDKLGKTLLEASKVQKGDDSTTTTKLIFGLLAQNHLNPNPTL